MKMIICISPIILGTCILIALSLSTSFASQRENPRQIVKNAGKTQLNAAGVRDQISALNEQRKPFDASVADIIQAEPVIEMNLGACATRDIEKLNKENKDIEKYLSNTIFDDVNDLNNVVKLHISELNQIKDEASTPQGLRIFERKIAAWEEQSDLLAHIIKDLNQERNDLINKSSTIKDMIKACNGVEAKYTETEKTDKNTSDGFFKNGQKSNIDVENDCGVGINIALAFLDPQKEDSYDLYYWINVPKYSNENVKTVKNIQLKSGELFYYAAFSDNSNFFWGKYKRKSSFDVLSMTIDGDEWNLIPKHVSYARNVPDLIFNCSMN
ncbi:hypothetical protein LQ948_02815 [Jiella sp. MQZ9-1]|uniref:Uncharacterized protein n=1 Tax=Jiella flava TaxID=2816857 RepID=A0A939FWF1_9HYPH|nr:hypothetical protein [Jiella flava]MBO0661496.1 hypothetical protein [Jiella flava]MCD2470138.1 hypothetical protein [Jiella flava]